MYIRRFNESTENSFKISDEEIRDFFIDYLDEDKEAVEIINGYVHDNGFEVDSYVTGGHVAKLIRVKISKVTGIDDEYLTSFEPVHKAIEDIERFYGLSGETDINFKLGTDYDEFYIEFIIRGKEADSSTSKKIDELLSELKDIFMKEKGFKYRKVTYRNNFLNITTPRDKGKNWPSSLIMLLNKIDRGEETGQASNRLWLLPLVEWRNKAHKNGFKMNNSGGDYQVVVRLKKID